MKLNQSFLRSFAMLSILIYHFWTFLTESTVEDFIVKIGFIGVDIFFFLSAYSMSKKSSDYRKILQKILKLYFEFVAFAIVYFLLKGWNSIDFFLTITFVSFFVKGGGSFLWFVPAFILFYLVFPLFCKWSFKGKGIIVLGAWFFIALLVSLFTSYTAIFIFLNRIPIILIGYYFKVIPSLRTKIILPTSILLFLLGIILLYFFYYKMRLHDPIVDLFYLTAIPLVISIVLFSSFFNDNIVTKWLSSFTFEAYGIQMAIGFVLINFLYGIFDSPIIINLCCLPVLLLLSYLVHFLFNRIETLFSVRS